MGPINIFAPFWLISITRHHTSHWYETNYKGAEARLCGSNNCYFQSCTWRSTYRFVVATMWLHSQSKWIDSK